MSNPVTTLALLRDARVTGETVAAIDHVLQLGYDVERAKRACRPYLDSVASAYGLLSRDDQEAAAQVAADAAIERGLDGEARQLAWAYLQIECARQIAQANVENTEAALAARRRIEAAVEDVPLVLPFAECAVERAQATLDLLEFATARARARWTESDEVREYAFGGESTGGGREQGHFHAPSEVEDQLREWTASGDWDTSEGTLWVTDYAWSIDPVTSEELDSDRVDIRVEFQPEAPDCTAEEHDFQSPHEVLGGIKENPGVWGKGGGIVCREVCAHCGVYRVTDTWAQDPSTGIQGLTSVSYEDADEDSCAWIEGSR